MAVTPTILINQATLGAGTAGQSRTDLVLSQLVTATDPANTSGTTYAWELVVPEGSSATLSGANTDTATFTPDVNGNYLLYLTVDGVNSYSINAIGEKVSTQGGGAVLDNGVPLPSPGETTQFNSTRGWAAGLDALLRDITGVTGGAQGEVIYVDSAGELARLAVGSSGEVLTSGGAGADPSWGTVAGSGDVVGPGSATDNALARFDTTTGKLLQNSGVTCDDSNNLSGIGNITLTGTVDGRDVATDGTKLDGIEASATADQSDAEIKTAYENNADTNAFTDADESKLDGIEASADVTDATNVAAAGAVMDSEFAGSYAGHMHRTGAAAYEVLKSNLAASVAPGATDDSASDYAVGSLWIDTTADDAYLCVDATATSAVWVQLDAAGGGSGDVTGPASATDDALARFDGTGGKTIQNSGWTLDDFGLMTASGNLDMNGNDIVIDADGDSTIGEPADDQILFTLGGSGNYRMNTTHFKPEGSANRDLGASGQRWRALYFQGGFNADLRAPVTTTTNLVANDFVAVSESGARINMHNAASGQDGQWVVVKNDDASSAATVGADGSDTIEGSATISLPAGSSVILCWDNSATDWKIIGGYHGTL